jgi:hypothetical protein
VNFNSTGAPAFARIGEGEYSYFLAVTSITWRFCCDGALLVRTVDPEPEAKTLNKNNDVM